MSAAERPPSVPLVGSISAVRCCRCGFVSPEPPDGDIECCWKGPDWQRVLLVPRAECQESRP